MIIPSPLVLFAPIDESATTRFADRGYEAVTLRAIAKEISYTHAVIRDLPAFPDKSHILAELSRETNRAAGSELRRDCR